MSEPVWRDATENAPVPERARRAIAALRASTAGAVLEKAGAEQARILCALASGSEWGTDMLIKHPGWLASVDATRLSGARQLQGLRREVEAWFEPSLRAADYAQALSKLRQFKQREMIRIAARDLARLAQTREIILEISNIADVCLSAVLRLCWHQLTSRFGTSFEQDAAGQWRETKFCVLGMGKLGGQELNYSSDVDVLFVYSDEGSVFKEPPRKGKAAKAVLTSHQFFTRVAEAFIAEVGRLMDDGALFRIDVRLRPEGDAGPLVRSLSSYENYYAQWGQTWERMMLIKARCVAGDLSLASEFLEMMQPFRYPRSVSEHVLDEISAMKQRIETEVVKRGELQRNVKLGRGGIREIEFVAQALQLLHAGRNPFLQGAQTLPALQKLVQYHLLTAEDAEALTHAYLFLRDVEHRLQMEYNRQTHSLPAAPAARERIARLMGFRDFELFEKARVGHSERVRVVYERLLTSAGGETKSELPMSFEDNGQEWQSVLEAHSFREPARVLKLLREFALGPGYGHVSARTTELAMQLIPKLLAFCPRHGGKNEEHRVAGDPGKATRLAANHPSPLIPHPVEGRGKSKSASEGAARSKESQRAIDLSLSPQRGEACDKSSAKQSASALSQPVLSDPDRVVARLDAFVSAYGARATLYEMWSSNTALFELMLLLFDRSEFLAEVAIRTPDLVDELVLSGHLQRRKTAETILEELRHGARDKDQRLWIRRYHQSELMRIGLRDILGVADAEQNFEELSALADACLHYALEVVMRKHKRKSAPFAIIGWGKLGGAELNYGSDLDITFVAPANARQLPRLQRLAVELMDLLSSPTEFGVAFVTDARLRPDGEKGLLVNTIDAYGEYYQRRGVLWEFQSLTRTRFIAGHATVGKQFRMMVAELTNFSRRPPVAAFTPDWKQQIAKMRERIEKERTPAGKDSIAIKTGSGGLIDAEFIAQMFCLERGWHEPNALAALQRTEREGALSKNDATTLIDNYRRLRRIEAILRRWSYAGETVLPDDPAPLYRVAIRCGFRCADEFMAALGEWRRGIREVYRKILP